MQAGDDGHGQPVLVTGASGVAGGHLALRLRRLGPGARRCDQAPTCAGCAPRVTLIEGDPRNRRDLLEERTIRAWNLTTATWLMPGS